MTGSAKEIRVKPKAERRLMQGHPWLYANEIEMDQAARAIQPGSVITLLRQNGEKIASAFFNPHSLIAGRVIAEKAGQEADTNFFRQRLKQALRLRQALYPLPYYRLAHAEADGLPGLIIDRYGDACVVQINSAGMDQAEPFLLEALEEVLSPQMIFIDKESPVRLREGLTLQSSWAKGGTDEPIALIENGATYFAHLGKGQKTGWFYDQRDNRALIRPLAKDRHVLDGYCYSGGFALQAALGGARSILAVDRSDAALALARQAASKNNLSSVTCERAEIFSFLDQCRQEQRTFGLTLMDPPAFIKSRKDEAAGKKGYRKLARAAALVTEQEGYLFLASCSHLISMADFLFQIASGIRDAGRKAKVLAQRGAGPDHPLHPFLPESAYLKSILLALD